MISASIDILLHSCPDDKTTSYRVSWPPSTPQHPMHTHLGRSLDLIVSMTRLTFTAVTVRMWCRCVSPSWISNYDRLFHTRARILSCFITAEKGGVARDKGVPSGLPKAFLRLTPRQVYRARVLQHLNHLVVVNFHPNPLCSCPRQIIWAGMASPSVRID